MLYLKVIVLFVFTALAEITGCYLPYLMLKEQRSLWLIIPTLISLTLFVWLLTLQPNLGSAGRTYAAYGGIYVAVALVWLKLVEQASLSRWDMIGASVALLGMALIAFQPGIK